MNKNDYVAVWTDDSYARLFLGQPPAPKPSRWVAAGKFQGDDESGVGFWLAVERFEERREDNTRVNYGVSPNVCLFRWDGIITIQHVKKGVVPEIGIRTS